MAFINMLRCLGMLSITTWAAIRLYTRAMMCCNRSAAAVCVTTSTRLSSALFAVGKQPAKITVISQHISAGNSFLCVTGCSVQRQCARALILAAACVCNATQWRHAVGGTQRCEDRPRMESADTHTVRGLTCNATVGNSHARVTPHRFHDRSFLVRDSSEARRRGNQLSPK